MRTLLLSLFLLPAAAYPAVRPGNVPAGVVRGTVRDAATGEPLAAANIRLLGTSRGTITTPAGEYSLAVDTGSCRLLFTMLGYAADTVVLRVTGEVRSDVRMEPAAIVLPEVVSTPEDPAIGIIRRAIDNKQRWIDRLRSYSMNAFTRMTIYRDTAIAAILESYTRGYWRAGDTLREVVTQRRQTSNVAEAFNLISVGRIVNFMDDEINLVGFSFVGPTARNALDYYDYRLVRT
ncbi:MAG TPA: carboxypeptidase-like regulatory domain-containing protein, partial [Bacteroidota bacterium]|nr:carboxypeptidase-like regulatory domain-containing protein [Bacteroidota bacterium]